MRMTTVWFFSDYCAENPILRRKRQFWAIYPKTVLYGTVLIVIFAMLLIKLLFNKN